MLDANTLFELSDEQEAQVDAVEGIIEAGIAEGLKIDDEQKTFVFKTDDISKQIKDEHGGLQVRVRKTVIKRCEAANWKVVHDEFVGTITLKAKPPRKARKPKVVVPSPEEK